MAGTNTTSGSVVSTPGVTGSGGGIGSINPFSAIGGAADALTNFLPQASEMSGDAGGIAAGLQGAWDGISDAAMAIPPVGTMIGGIMKAANFVGRGLNALGAGTDGMCVCAGTQVFTSTGKLINIEDLQQDDGIIGWDPISKTIRPQTIAHLITPSIKDCVEIKLKHGQILRCSIDHPILSDTLPKAKSKIINGKRLGIRQWKFRRADELKVGNFIGLANNIDVWGNENLDLAYLVGLLIGDGSYGKGQSCRLSTSDPIIWRYLEENNLGVINHCNKGKIYKSEFRTYRIIGGIKLMKELGLAYQTCNKKTLPKDLHKFNKNSICEMLAGFFDSDGSVNSDIVLYQTHLKILESVRMQLQKLGIFSTISKRKASNPNINGKIRNSKESYRLSIKDRESIINFYNQIKLRIPHKKANLEKLYSQVLTKSAKEYRILSGAKQSKIISITYIGKQTVYNLQANNDHTYLANGIITHNTTADAVLGSPFFNLTPFGLINGIFGKKADTFTKDNEVFAQMGSAYGGSDSQADLAARKSGKKYGLFSQSAMADANRQIREADRQQDTIRDIQDDMNNQNLLAASMSQINNQAYMNRLQGGYQQGLIRAAKKGSILENKDAINRAKSFFKNQSDIKNWDTNILQDKEFYNFLKSCPQEIKEYQENLKPLYNLWSTNGKPSTFQQAIDLVIPFFTTNPKTGKFNINDDFKLYSSLIHDDNFGIKKLNKDLENTSSEDLQSFKEGGQLNVIPEGALHAHKHNLEEIDENLKGNITHKGIPVVSVDEDGNIEQQAEVERNELILNLETTEAIEELRKEWHDEESPSKKDKLAEEAGRIFAKSVIENTDDRTNLMEEI